MWHKSLYDTAAQARARGLCLYGAGAVGDAAYQIFEKLGTAPLCYCDDDPKKAAEGNKRNGAPIYSLEEAKERYPEAVYLVCVDSARVIGKNNRANLDRMTERLKQHGLYDANSELRVVMYLFLLDIDDFFRRPCLDQEEDGLFAVRDLNYLLALNHMANSGSYYFEQLLDSHPNILCVPYSGSVWEKVYENRLKLLEGEELLIEMAAQMLGYFHSRHEASDCVRTSKFGNYCLGPDGEFLYECLIDPVLFMRHLRAAFEGEIKLTSCGHMLKAYFAAYNNCLGRRKAAGEAYWMLYHMHISNYNVERMYESISPGEFLRYENVLLIREPVQQCFTWMKRSILEEKEASVLIKGERDIFTQTLLCEMGSMTEKKEGFDNVKAVRFEDLKFHAKGSMKALCKWLGIPYDDILLETTLNGTCVYFPANTPEGVKYITGQDPAAVRKKDFREVMTLWDEARLSVVFSKFRAAYGYETGGAPEFTELGSGFLKELLRQDFKLADLAQELIDKNFKEEDRYDVNAYVKELFLGYMEKYQEKGHYECIRPEMGGEG